MVGSRTFSRVQHAVQHAREDAWMISRTVVKYFLDGVGAILLMMGLSAVSGSGWFLLLGLFSLFLGVTDFGRQCPLILSVRHLAYRISSKPKPHILTANPIEEVGEGDHKDIHT